ncbi:hypothetical protein CAEBREN_19178 [Caenorhabditis brenneri]|uniref:histone acetyltransferase n=1 Tax=Caenorhabditis brenneri TaxID=135651 RepID=G0N753_CAEBE|nr:hypothetical protein CAEBREN_19178 [Caenorhabditis brenneri]
MMNGKKSSREVLNFIQNTERNSTAPISNNTTEHVMSTRNRKRVLADSNASATSSVTETGEKKRNTVKNNAGRSESSSTSTDSTPTTHEKLTCCPEAPLVELQYNSSNRTCHGGCTIFIGDEYMRLKGIHYCMNCAATRNYKRWTKVVNRNDSVEKIVRCVNAKCGKAYHRCCSLHVQCRSPFYCPDCARDLKPMILYEGYEPNQCDIHIRTMLNEYLKKTLNDGEELQNPISVASFKTKQEALIKNLVPSLCLPAFNTKYPSGKINYDLRSIYVFQRIEDVDVLVFAMYCQEYIGLDGNNWAVIHYMDSVPYVVSKSSGGFVFGEAIIAYLSYVKSIGFNKAHFFADPPAHANDDYIFRIHPSTHPYMTIERLIKWYNNVLKKAKEMGVVKSIRTFSQEQKRRPYDGPTSLTLFDDGLWSRVMIEAAEEINFTEQTKIEAEFKKRLEEKFEVNAENNFFLDLSRIPFFVQEDSTRVHYVLGNQDAFVKKCRRKNWEFSSLRRAKFASVGIIRMCQNGY